MIKDINGNNNIHIDKMTRFSGPFLRVEYIHKSFGDKAVLKGVEFTAEAGTIVGIIGPNGSGKTTLFKILTSLIRPDDGDFWRDGISGMTDWQEVRNYIAYCPEKLPFDWSVNGLDYLELFMQIYGRSRKDVREVLDKVGLLDDSKRPVRKYSLGMLKRLSLARILLIGGRFLLFDEPTAGLDPQGQRMIQDLLLTMDKSDKVVLISSHNLYEIQRICDVILSLKDGKVKAVDSVKDAFDVGGLTIIELVLKDAPDSLVDSLLKNIENIKLISRTGPRIRLSSEEKVDLIEIAAFIREHGGNVVEIKYL